MQIRSVVVLASLGLASLAHGQQAVQWCIQDGGNGHWYRFDAENREWPTAQAMATLAGGHLATTTTPSELVFLNQLIAASNPIIWVWLGGSLNCGSAPTPNCSACSWQWVTGESWDFSFWSPGEPNCGYSTERVATGGGLWVDIYSPGYAHQSIWEWSADCNGDGIVDYGQILDGTFADSNENGVPDCCDAGDSCAPCPSDIDQNGRTDGIDLAIILGRWGTNPKDYPRADTNQDSTVDATDLSVVLAGWGNCP